MTRLARATVVLTALASLAAPADHPAAQPLPGGGDPLPKTPIPYATAAPILERLQASLPADLAAVPPEARASEWPAWVARRDAEIRARLRRGDEDSVVNLLLFGTSFTTLPRALNDSSRIGGRERAASIVRGRTADLLAAAASPGSNERLAFVRQVLAREKIDPATPAGRERGSAFLAGLMARVTGEAGGYARTVQTARAEGRPELAVRSSLYRARGLSSDTSIRPDFAIDQALESIAGKRLIAAGSVRRVAVIGPGLDFTDKAEGHDFYPQQITQPFALIGSLLQLGLAPAGALRLTTLDINPRVNLHLDAARQRAAAGEGYEVVLPRERDGRWQRGFLGFWQGFGRSIGEDTGTSARPANAGDVEVRKVRIAPAIVQTIVPRDLDIVVERLGPLADDDRFDLVVATNVLVYYDVFEQSLALANIAAMLRPGGFLLSNNVLVELPATPIGSIGSTAVKYSDGLDDTDEVIWYQRR